MQLCEQLFCSVPNCGCRGVLNHCIWQVPGGKGSLSGLTLNTSTTRDVYLHDSVACHVLHVRSSPGLILLRRSDVYARSGSLGRSNDGGQASGDVGCSGCSSPEVLSVSGSPTELSRTVVGSVAYLSGKKMNSVSTDPSALCSSTS